MIIAVREAPPLAPPRGLDEGEAAARLGRGDGNDAHLHHSQSYLHILARNGLTFLNGVLFAIGVALLALGRVNDAITTVGVMVLNLLVGTVQELYAKRKLDRIALLSRPTATVLREGRERAWPPARSCSAISWWRGPVTRSWPTAVWSKALDVDESLLTGESDLVTKVAGDAVYSGSICMGGRALYEATQVGAASLANQLTAGARAFRLVKTPLQRDIDLVIRIVLLMVFQLGLLLAAGAYLRHTSLIEGVQIVAVVAGLVPNGLIPVITTAYALGALRMAGKGAVLQRANAVESLSHVDILCLDKTGTLTSGRNSLWPGRPSRAARRGGKPPCSGSRRPGAPRSQVVQQAPQAAGEHALAGRAVGARSPPPRRAAGAPRPTPASPPARREARRDPAQGHQRPHRLQGEDLHLLPAEALLPELEGVLDTPALPVHAEDFERVLGGGHRSVGEPPPRRLVRPLQSHLHQPDLARVPRPVGAGAHLLLTGDDERHRRDGRRHRLALGARLAALAHHQLGLDPRQRHEARGQVVPVAGGLVGGRAHQAVAVLDAADQARPLPPDRRPDRRVVEARVEDVGDVGREAGPAPRRWSPAPPASRPTRSGTPRRCC